MTTTMLTACAKEKKYSPASDITTSNEETKVNEQVTTTPLNESPTTWEESISWATKEEMKEALDKLQVPDSIQHVILENETIIDSSDGKEKALTDVVAANESKVGYINSVRTVDIDQDGTKELIISGMKKDNRIVGSYIVLRVCNDVKVCVYSFETHRVNIAETGYIRGSDGADRGIIFTLAFEGYEVKKVDKATFDYEIQQYLIDGKEVSSEEFQKFMEPHDFDNSNEIRIYYLLN